MTIDQGLSQNTVKCILQDRKGFMWFGTRDGLNRFDGYDIKVYEHDPDNPNSLSGNHIWEIYEEPASDRGKKRYLWIATLGGLNRFDRESEIFTHYRHDLDDPRRAVPN
ncbi:MAG: two-component regulator propeller domain-containing protein [bacterium]